jgi:hypothetical protein
MNTFPIRNKSAWPVLCTMGACALALSANFIGAETESKSDASDIQQLQFADGSSISWADFLKRGLVQHGAANSVVLGSEYNDVLSGMAQRPRTRTSYPHKAAANDFEWRRQA